MLITKGIDKDNFFHSPFLIVGIAFSEYLFPSKFPPRVHATHVYR